MSMTNFAALVPKQKIVWSRDVWSAARDMAFSTRFTGTGDNNVCQRITDLTKTEKGEKALMQLVADLVEDGVVGDNEREGNEEALQSFYQEIGIDQLSHQVRNRGKLSDQKTVIKFREQAKDKLAYWLANRIDQLWFLTLSGIAYSKKNNGANRTSTAFPSLAFAADVRAPSAKRHVRWTGSALVAGDTAAIDSSHVPSYKMVTEVVAYAKDHYIKPLIAGGKEYYVWFVDPMTLAKLKQDPDYQRAVTNVAMKDGQNSPWFTGGTVTIDGLVIHEHRLVYNTKGAASGSKWGGSSATDGVRTMVCGAQALGMVDLGPPSWVEKYFDYDNQQGISVDKMFGLLKPAFYSIYDGTTEDFGALALDLYRP